MCTNLIIEVFWVPAVLLLGRYPWEIKTYLKISCMNVHSRMTRHDQRQEQDGQGCFQVLALPFEVPHPCPNTICWPVCPNSLCAHRQWAVLHWILTARCSSWTGSGLSSMLVDQLYSPNVPSCSRPFLTWPLCSKKPRNFVGLWWKICWLPTTQQDSHSVLFSKVCFSLSLHHATHFHSTLPLVSDSFSQYRLTSAHYLTWVAPFHPPT